MSNRKSRSEIGYKPTTTSADHESWVWYQETLSELEERKMPGWRPKNPLTPGQPLPVSMGMNFCLWALETPEVRDIIFRRFVQGDYENDVEAMLLRAASFHFLHRHGYSIRHYATLSLCWRVVRDVITGVYPAADSVEVKTRLLRYDKFFAPTKLN